MDNIGSRRIDTDFDPPRVLIGAYACGPLAEPEARAGWEFAKAATRDYEVWVITRPRFRESIDATFAADPALAQRLHVHYFDLSRTVLRLKRHWWDLYWYYLLWQRGAGRFARDLNARHRFDVAHHATFANDWMPSGLTALKDVPLVWGPVGGSSDLPLRKLSRWLGVRGTTTELLRSLLTKTARRVGGDPTARRSALVVAQNRPVGRHFATRGSTVVVEPNASLESLPLRADRVSERTAVFAGRLLAWKGAALAIDTIAHPRSTDWRLRIFGAGYEETRLRERVIRLGLEDRVEFCGHRPRDEVLHAIAEAQVFLFPSMHDQAGWVVAEASSIGVPVVCLPLGGPPLLAEPNAFVASLHGDIVANLAEQLQLAGESGGTPTDRWMIDRLPDVVSRWYRTAMGDEDEPDLDPARTIAPQTRVLESFGLPKPTTNPYITQLYRSLSDRSDTVVVPFTYRAAIVGSYDVVHLHWPELMMGGHTWRGRVARRSMAAFAIARWTITRVPVVRTLHNLEWPTNTSRSDRFLLGRIDALTTLDIRLNDQTPVRRQIEGVTIPHGHYREWFASVPRADPVPGRIGYVGLIRRYKGVEDLVAAFVDWEKPGASLQIAGKPSTPELVAKLVEAAQGDERISIDPRFLDESELVHAITSSELVVLPYRHMHNSGTALAALSLARPILVPDNEVNRALAGEVGAGWVHLFRGDLSTTDIDEAWRSSRTNSGTPDLTARGWPQSAEAHADAFRQALRSR